MLLMFASWKLLAPGWMRISISSLVGARPAMGLGLGIS